GFRSTANGDTGGGDHALGANLTSKSVRTLRLLRDLTGNELVEARDFEVHHDFLLGLVQEVPPVVTIEWRHEHPAFFGALCLAIEHQGPRTIGCRRVVSVEFRGEKFRLREIPCRPCVYRNIALTHAELVLEVGEGGYGNTDLVHPVRDVVLLEGIVAERMLIVIALCESGGGGKEKDSGQWNVRNWHDEWTP